MTSELPIDTWIFPLVQMGPLGVTVDEEVTSGILNSADSDMECYLASGYFNLTKKYMETVLRSNAKFNILMASPEVSVTPQSNYRYHVVQATWNWKSRGHVHILRHSGFLGFSVIDLMLG